MPTTQPATPSSRARETTWKDWSMDKATEMAFASAWRLVRWLPERRAYALFDKLADFLWTRRGEDVVMLERNYARVRPASTDADLRDMSRQGLRSYMRYWCEAFRLPSWSRARIQDSFGMLGVEDLDRAVAERKGVILIGSHSGNWDLAGAWAAGRFGGLTSVAERLRPEGLFQRFVAKREALGIEVLPLGSPGVVEHLVTRLKAGGVVALVGDRDISRHGVEVDFFGQVASFPAGPAILALESGAPLYTVALWYAPGKAMCGMGRQVPVPEEGTRAEKIKAMTQGIADGLEEGIREHTVDWHMMQPVWLADLDLARREGHPVRNTELSS